MLDEWFDYLNILLKFAFTKSKTKNHKKHEP